MSDEPTRQKSVVTATKDRKPPPAKAQDTTTKQRISVKDRLGIRRTSPEILRSSSRNNRVTDVDRKGENRPVTTKKGNNRTSPARPVSKRDENVSPSKRPRRGRRTPSIERKSRERETARNKAAKVTSRLDIAIAVRLLIYKFVIIS